MDTYTIRPHARAYRLEAIAPDGGRRLVAAYPTEQDAIAHLRRLQARVGVPPPEERRARDWRG